MPFANRCRLPYDHLECDHPAVDFSRPHMHHAPDSNNWTWLQPLLTQHQGQAGGLLPLLHDIQDRMGFVPAGAVPLIAQAMNLSRAEVHGVISYYHHFRTTPAGKVVLQICQAEACQSVGAEALTEHAKRALGIDFHETTPDGSVTLEPVYCLGHCACGPSIMMGEKLHARVDQKSFDRLLARARSDA